MASSEGCSPYALSVGILIGIFIGREDNPEFDQQQEQLEPLGAPPGPLQYRILSTVIADQLHAIARAEDKGLGELQDEIREAFSHSHFGRSVADRLGQRLLLVRSPDDLVDLVAGLDLVLMKPEGEETWSGHGQRERKPMYLRANSVFGVFIRRIKATCDGSSFSRLSSIYEGIVRYSDNNRRGDSPKRTTFEPCADRALASRDVRAAQPSDLSVDMMDDISMDLGSPLAYGRSSNGIEGFPGGSGIGNGGPGGHIGAFLQRQQVTGEPFSTVSGKPSEGVEAEEKEGPSLGGGGGRGQGGEAENIFPREVSAWQLQRRLQRKVLRLENGLSSQVPFEDIESEVQVTRDSASE
ncbi:unnamed protein product [Hapterophycus canaliculatus]